MEPVEEEKGGMSNTPTAPKSLQAFLHAQHIDHTIPPLDALSNLDVLWVLGIEVVRHKPFVDAEDTTGLQYTCDLGIDCLEGGRIDGSFGSIDEVEVVVREGNMLYQRVRGLEWIDWNIRIETRTIKSPS